MAPKKQTEAPAKPRNDAWVGLLAVSFLALSGALVLLILEYDRYGTVNPPKTPAPADLPGSPKGGPQDNSNKNKMEEPKDPMGDKMRKPLPPVDLPPLAAIEVTQAKPKPTTPETPLTLTNGTTKSPFSSLPVAKPANDPKADIAELPPIQLAPLPVDKPQSPVAVAPFPLAKEAIKSEPPVKSEPRRLPASLPVSLEKPSLNDEPPVAPSRFEVPK